MAKATFVLGTDGTVSTVYRDSTRPIIEALVALNPRTTKRASTVELEGGEWVSKLLDGHELCRGPNREEVVEEEHRLIEAMLSRGEPVPGV